MNHALRLTWPNFFTAGREIRRYSLLATQKKCFCLQYARKSCDTFTIWFYSLFRLSRDTTSSHAGVSSECDNTITEFEFNTLFESVRKALFVSAGPLTLGNDGDLGRLSRRFVISIA